MILRFASVGLLLFACMHLSIAALLARGVASHTYYNSYPECCFDAPNYNPISSTIECSAYSGCTYMGMHAGYVTSCNPTGFVPFEHVRHNNMIAFYDNNDPTGKNFTRKYALRTIVLTKIFNGVTYKFNATITDTCGNADCNNCCAINAGINGYLVDMEYFTVVRNFGTTSAADGTILFEVFS
jgi:hypothetical protein